MSKTRLNEIDILRAFGIIAVIAIHVLTYNLTDSLNKFIWNYFQFFVVVFVFCSGFVLTNIYENHFTGISTTFFWYKKRLIRIVFPFWVYLVIHYLLWIFFPSFFSGMGMVKGTDYFIKSFSLLAGTNFNFLPLLFLQLTILFPFLVNWISKKKIITVYLLGASAITLIFTLFKFPYNYYRFVMWVPWSLVLIFAIYLVQKLKTKEDLFAQIKKILIYGLYFFIPYLILYLLFLNKSTTTIFYDHKYPPDFYYILYGLSFTCFSFVIAKLHFWENKYIKNAYNFLSVNSYKIFFIHYIVLDFILTLKGRIFLLANPFNQFVVILFITIAFSVLVQKFINIFNRNFGIIKL